MAYEQSAGYPSGMMVGVLDAGTQTFSDPINSALVMHTSGDAWFARVSAARAMSAATLTLYVYIGAVVGDPTFQLQVWDGATGAEDDDRPSAGGSNLASSPSTLTLSSSDDGTWGVLTCTVSLAIGQTYFLIVENTHATPASNHATFCIRGTLDSLTLGSVSSNLLGPQQAGFTLDGWNAGDGTIGGGTGPFCIKYGDGTKIGFAYVSSETHASDALDRGVRVQFSEDVVTSGGGFSGSTSSLVNLEINAASGGANKATLALDRYQEINRPVGRWTPATLTGASSYDFVETFSASSTTGTIYGMGEAEGSLPSDVLACRPQGWAYVNDVGAAGPGSYTVDTSKIMQFALILDDNPAIAGGGAGRGMPRGAV